MDTVTWKRPVGSRMPLMRAVFSCQLWLLIPEPDRRTMSPSVINNPPTHMEIAIMLNISRETVTRVFQILQNRQIVRRDGPARLQVSDLNALKAFAEGRQEF